MSKSALIYKIALTQIPMVGAVLAKNLVSYSGGPEAVFAQKKQHLLKIPGIGPAVADHIVQKRSFPEAEVELNFIEKHGIGVLFYLDDDYPYRLKRINDAPIILYSQGKVDLNAQRVLGIVGTRKPTYYGVNQCEKLVESLRDHGVMVISGLAYGIDVTAHRKALEVGLSTVAVLGSGLGRIYPAAHKKVALDMLNDGALLTEFVHDAKPDREHFPMRNRIIAGMCDALVVVESNARGGSMITAELANGYHKDVFAFPGRIGDQWSKGCNNLIKSDKAHLLDSGAELATYMQWVDQSPVRDVQRSLFADLSEDEQLVCNMLQEASPISIDKLYNTMHLTASEMASILLGLEFKGLIKALPGKMYMIV